MREEEIKALRLFNRGRNIIYYRSIDDRPRAQYMHVLRDFRNDIKSLLINTKKDFLMKNTLEEIIKIIPSKVKTDECDLVINNLNKIIYNNVIQ